MDIPHYFMKNLNYWLYKREAKKEINPKPFVDES